MLANLFCSYVVSCITWGKVVVCNNLLRLDLGHHWATIAKRKWLNTKAIVFNIQ